MPRQPDTNPQSSSRSNAPIGKTQESTVGSPMITADRSGSSSRCSLTHPATCTSATGSHSPAAIPLPGSSAWKATTCYTRKDLTPSDYQQRTLPSGKAYTPRSGHIRTSPTCADSSNSWATPTTGPARSSHATRNTTSGTNTSSSSSSRWDSPTAPTVPSTGARKTRQHSPTSRSKTASVNVVRQPS